MRVKVVHSSCASMSPFGSRYKHRVVCVPAALLSLLTTSSRHSQVQQEGSISGTFPRMEYSPGSKPSVAELAGRFKGHILPMPTSNNESSFRRKPPCSLKLQSQKDDDEESDQKTIVSPNPFKIKMKNSSIIEKLQANLALSPTALLPSPKSPEAKLQSAPLSPTTPGTPQSPLSPTLRPSHLSSEDEDPVSFDGPPEGTPLPSINKTRARLSFKRRPPTRQHRRSAGEERASGSALSPCELYSPNENGDTVTVFDYGQLEEAEEKDRDWKETEDEVASDPDDSGDSEKEQEAQQAQNFEALEEEQQPSEPGAAGQMEGAVETKGNEDMPRDEHQGGNDTE
ncbi:LOW QUALITY PROTEIN: capZ-interacting protein [Etheostoma cragini]|uniref:LOW QUALITY PROTEIN: capZ-interacting protein n=1 Tax=Etheostoma cragini TaxID=417921 RepID=UPI00155F083D|nr:LOW QUALITY PROTEIN: capZ-interacting protein [Etheostoma cragini]